MARMMVIIIPLVLVIGLITYGFVTAKMTSPAVKERLKRLEELEEQHNLGVWKLDDARKRDLER